MDNANYVLTLNKTDGRCAILPVRGTGDGDGQ
jgi:hypothetical protein